MTILNFRIKTLSALLFFISSISYAQSDFGVWGRTCDEGEFSIQLSTEPGPLIVNENQIVIEIHSKKISTDHINIYFDKALDLGQGGMTLDWDNFSKTRLLAELTFKGNTGKFKWHGFYDNRKKTHAWVDGPDFIQDHAENGVITLKKCD